MPRRLALARVRHQSEVARSFPTPTPTSSTSSTSSTPPMMKVPVEIMYQIVEAVARPLLNHIMAPSPTSTLPTQPEATQALQTLSNLCLTSHLLYEITTPILYREFALGYNDVPGAHFKPWYGQRMVSFARTLLARRDLAALVKRAFLHPKLVGLMGDENRMMISALAKKTLCDDVYKDKAIEVLIFALMPNLECMVFAGLSWTPIPAGVTSLAWPKLKGLHQVEEYGWSFSETELIRHYEAEIACGIPLGYPDEDDDDL
ncbi:hypothetical protein OQA88_3441 [Cercophora sp. LCS_1]